MLLERQSSRDSGPLGDAREPSFDIRKLSNVLAQFRPNPDPRKIRDIGNRVCPRDVLATLQTLFEDAEKTLDLFRIAIDRVGDFFRRCVQEMLALSSHRAKPADVPEQPLVDFSLGTFA